MLAVVAISVFDGRKKIYTLRRGIDKLSKGFSAASPLSFHKSIKKSCPLHGREGACCKSLKFQNAACMPKRCEFKRTLVYDDFVVLFAGEN
jgi:hypothetical protein